MDNVSITIVFEPNNLDMNKTILKNMMETQGGSGKLSANAASFVPSAFAPSFVPRTAPPPPPPPPTTTTTTTAPPPPPTTTTTTLSPAQLQLQAELKAVEDRQVQINGQPEHRREPTLKLFPKPCFGTASLVEADADLLEAIEVITHDPAEKQAILDRLKASTIGEKRLFLGSCAKLNTAELSDPVKYALMALQEIQGNIPFTPGASLQVQALTPDCVTFRECCKPAVVGLPDFVTVFGDATEAGECRAILVDEVSIITETNNLHSESIKLILSLLIPYLQATSPTILGELGQLLSTTNESDEYITFLLYVLDQFMPGAPVGDFLLIQNAIEMLIACRDTDKTPEYTVKEIVAIILLVYEEKEEHTPLEKKMLYLFEREYFCRTSHTIQHMLHFSIDNPPDDYSPHQSLFTVCNYTRTYEQGAPSLVGDARNLDPKHRFWGSHFCQTEDWGILVAKNEFTGAVVAAETIDARNKVELVECFGPRDPKPDDTCPLLEAVAREASKDLVKGDVTTSGRWSIGQQRLSAYGNMAANVELPRHNDSNLHVALHAASYSQSKLTTHQSTGQCFHVALERGDHTHYQPLVLYEVSCLGEKANFQATVLPIETGFGGRQHRHIWDIPAILRSITDNLNDAFAKKSIPSDKMQNSALQHRLGGCALASHFFPSSILTTLKAPNNVPNEGVLMEVSDKLQNGILFQDVAAPPGLKMVAACLPLHRGDGDEKKLKFVKAIRVRATARLNGTKLMKKLLDFKEFITEIGKVNVLDLPADGVFTKEQLIFFTNIIKKLPGINPNNPRLNPLFKYTGSSDLTQREAVTKLCLSYMPQITKKIYIAKKNVIWSVFADYEEQLYRTKATPGSVAQMAFVQKIKHRGLSVGDNFKHRGIQYQVLERYNDIGKLYFVVRNLQTGTIETMLSELAGGKRTRRRNKRTRRRRTLKFR